MWLKIWQRCDFTCRFAGVPTSLSPSAVNATTEGVVRDPSAFSNTLGVLPSIMATQELVVPKSIPQTAPRTVSELHENGEPEVLGPQKGTMR